MPLAQRPLEVASADIELLINGAVEQVGADGAGTVAQGPDDEFRPRWVRRMDEWATPPTATAESGDWDDDWESASPSAEPSVGALPAPVSPS